MENLWKDLLPSVQVRSYGAMLKVRYLILGENLGKNSALLCKEIGNKLFMVFPVTLSLIE